MSITEKDSQVHRSSNIVLWVIALGVLVIAGMMAWSSYSAGKLSECRQLAVTNGNALVTYVGDSRWSTGEGCEYLFSIEGQSPTWVSQTMVIDIPSTPK